MYIIVKTSISTNPKYMDSAPTIALAPILTFCRQHPSSAYKEIVDRFGKADVFEYQIPLRSENNCKIWGECVRLRKEAPTPIPILDEIIRIALANR